jgi:hypothetical protein
MMVPEKVPSYIFPQPHEGLFCLSIASLILTEAGEKVGRTEAKISKKKDCAFRIDEGVPVTDDTFVHLIGGLKRSPSIADDIGMSKMGIGDEPFFHADLIKSDSHIVSKRLPFAVSFGK